MVKESQSVIEISRILKTRVACITLDIEQDFGDLLNEPRYEGLDHIGELVAFLKQRNIPVTCFVQASLLETHPTRIEALSGIDAELELHSYSHPHPGKGNQKYQIEKGRETFRNYFGRDPSGYRAPLGVITEPDYEVLAANCFKFDSSIFPSIRPGTFNNLGKPIKPYFVAGHRLVEFPLAVLSNRLRIPLSLSYMKLFGRGFPCLLKAFNLPHLVIFNAHLHDLFALRSADEIDYRQASPTDRFIFDRVYRKSSAGSGMAILEQFIRLLGDKGYHFARLDSVYQSIPGVLAS